MILSPPPEFFNTYNKLITTNSIGLFRFHPEQLQKMNLNGTNKANDNLVGHIKNEYILNIDDFRNIIDPIISEYEKHAKKYLDLHHKLLTNKFPELNLYEVWMNKQKKYEFNPLHFHNGVYSFVIWYDIPYTNEEEAKCSPYIGRSETESNLSGNFAFIDVGGDVLHIAADNKWNGVMAIFPSETQHMVYPFYSTDRERITISGNYGVKNE
jgi:hypothetical protein